ncbi:head tail adaptor protein [Campylobacter phage PC10]|nr:head tail adaptor protein [Campylobacter phage PC10]
MRAVNLILFKINFLPTPKLKKNYVLMAFDGVSMPKISSALITRYKIAYF